MIVWLVFFISEETLHWEFDSAWLTEERARSEAAEIEEHGTEAKVELHKAY